MYQDIINSIREKDKYLSELIESIEKLLRIDFYSVIIKSRTIAEIITKNIAKEEGLTHLLNINQNERIDELQREGLLDNEIYKALHTIRVIGNKCVHDKIDGSLENSLTVNRNLFSLLNWYVAVYIDHNFIEKEYVEPQFTQDNNSYENQEEAIISKILDKLLAKGGIEELLKNHILKDKDMSKLQEVALTENKEDEEKVYNDIKEKFYIQVKQGGSPYIVYVRERLRQVLNKDKWTFSTGDGAITIYNKQFREVFDNLNIKLPSRMNLQFWMKRPLKEVGKLQIEIAGAGIEYKTLRVALSNSLKSKLEDDAEIILSKPTSGLVMTLNIKALGTVANEDDTLENLEHNIENIETGVAKFVNYFEEGLVDKWIENEARDIVMEYFNK